MPKYFNFKVGDYYLYFTSQCIVEAMHVHASDKKLTEAGSAKFWVGSNGEVKVQNKGRLSEKSINTIIKFIQANYESMYKTWKKYSNNGFYNNF